MGYYQLIGAGISALGQMDEASKRKEAANLNADAIEADSALKAAKIRKLATNTQSQARAATAAAGVDVNSPTAKVIDQSIQDASSEDVMNQILTGRRQASSMRKTGQAYQTAGNINALGTVASAFNSDYGRDTLSKFGNWKTARSSTAGSGVGDT